MTWDVAIIGAGVAGTFAALRMVEKHSDASVILFDIGRPPGKRRRQIEGFLGCFPTGDGKLYENDLERVKNVVDGRKATPAYKWVHSYLEEVNRMKLVKTPRLSAACRKRLKKAEYSFEYNNYYQWKPESVHDLSKLVSEIFEDSPNLTYSFDNEVFSLRKNSDGLFEIQSEEGTALAKKVILAVGRSGWRWVTNLYDDLGIISCDDFMRFGVRVEMNAADLGDFNKSHCTLKNADESLELGPFQWAGTIIPEDHSDLVISAFRSNEDRWKSRKVTFSLLRTHFFQDQGSVQADRLGKLSFLMFNDRVSREKIKTFIKGKSNLNLIPEFNWLKKDLEALEDVVPGICQHGYFHVPHIDPKPAEIRIGPNLETEVEGMFVTGEAAGIPGLLSAAITGSIAADSACK